MLTFAPTSLPAAAILDTAVGVLTQVSFGPNMGGMVVSAYIAADKTAYLTYAGTDGAPPPNDVVPIQLPPGLWFELDPLGPTLFIYSVAGIVPITFAFAVPR